jgi:hypothetical protein
MLLCGVDQGHDFFDAKTIVANTEREGGGLTASTFAVFAPGHEFTLRGKHPDCSKAVLRCEAQADGSVILYQHSGYGEGTRVIPDPRLLMVDVQVTGKAKLEECHCCFSIIVGTQPMIMLLSRFGILSNCFFLKTLLIISVSPRDASLCVYTERLLRPWPRRQKFTTREQMSSKS